jgi:putative inorganic carbon (HCO3(-)) transporter
MYQSFIASFIYNAVLRLVSSYKCSKTCEMVGFLGEKLRDWLGGSGIFRFFARRERTTVYWHGSVSFKVIRKVLETLFSSSGKVRRAFTRVMEGSIAARFVSVITERFTFLICFFILIITVIPDSKWHNSYGILTICVIAFLYAFRTSQKEKYRPDAGKLDFTFLIFILAVFVSSVTSIDFAGSMKILLLNGAMFLLVFIIVDSTVGKSELGLLVYSVAVSVTIASICGIWQYINHVPVDPLLVDTVMGKGVGRIFSTMGNPNVYAGFLIMSLPFFGAAFFNAKRRDLKAAVAVMAALAVANLALTYSRASYVAFVVAILVFVFLKDWRWIPALMLFCLLLFPFLPASVVDRMRNLGKDTSSLYRVEIWKAGFNILKDYWVTGIGAGREPFAKLFSNYARVTSPAHSHMFPLQLWLEYGIVGFLSFAWFIARIIKKGFISICGKSDEYVKNVITACIASLAGIFTIGAVEHIWFYQRAANMFWITIGILMSALNLTYNREGAPYGKE